MKVGWVERSRALTRTFLIGRVDVSLMWKPADLWVGVYVHLVPEWHPPHDHVHVWICLVPTLPIHIHWVRWQPMDKIPF